MPYLSSILEFVKNYWSYLTTVGTGIWALNQYYSKKQVEKKQKNLNHILKRLSG